MKKINSIISILIVSIILFTNIASIAVEIKPQTIYISSPDDLYKLSQNCSFDRYSRGKTIVLEKDIYLNNKAFIPIPIFSGTFDGRGNTIYGLSITVEGSNQGLFRYLQEGGIIKNLNVKGTVVPEGEKSYIGGIVGYNEGIIEDCNFSGHVKGRDVIGGVAGWNGTHGVLINCATSGLIYGEHKVGGTVGYNAGTILRCFNESYVNTTIEEYKLDFKDITIEDINISKLTPDATDIGGISGVNTGIIQKSENSGTIGYPHVGYNLGGIAGRQTGYVADCINYGIVYGRRGIGGIVGKMEPHTTKLIPPSKLKQLQRELSILQSSITRMINNTKVSSDEISRQLSTVQGDLNNSRGYAQSLINQTEQFLNKDIDEINKISVTAVEAMDRMIPIIRALNRTIKIMDKAMDPIKKALKSMLYAMDKIPQLEEEWEEMSKSLGQFIVKMDEIQKKLTESFPETSEILELLQKGEIEAALKLLELAWDNISQVEQDFLDSIEYLRETGKSITGMINLIGDVTEHLGYSLKKIVDAIEIMEQGNDEIRFILTEINDILIYLVKQPEIHFETTDDLYQRTKEELYDSMDIMSASLSTFIDAISVRGEIMMEDMQMINDQLFTVMDLILNIVIEISEGDIDIDDIVTDISQKDVEGSTEGKVSQCKNMGIIEGDINVGGIAGTIGIELKAEEEESDVISKPLINATYHIRALVYKCENNGEISSKKNNSGGIVGSMDLGYIYDCIATGTVESTDGNYVGGIVGKSYGTVSSSHAKCRLKGGNYVGGIAGYGTGIVSCYTLVKIERHRACTGAIAGNIDKKGMVKTNYFVSTTLAGIDGISYMGKAEPISYDELISKENIPIVFKQFKLKFWAGDRLIKSMDLSYGDIITEGSLPKIPTKEGYYGRWEKFNVGSIMSDTDINAEYIPYLTVLESEKKRDVLPIVLVEGKFTEEDSLDLIYEERSNLTLPEGQMVLEQWNVSIPEDGGHSHIIRYLPPEGIKNLSVHVLSADGWNKTASQWDGKYLVFETIGNDILFAVIKMENYYIKYIIIIGSVFLIIALFTLYYRCKRR